MEVIEGLLQIGDIVGCMDALYQHVIHIDFHVSPKLILEDLVHQPLISCSCILEAEGYYLVAVNAFLGHEGSVLLIVWVHLYLVIPEEGIHEAEEFVTGHRVHQLVDLWQRKAILLDTPC